MVVDQYETVGRLGLTSLMREIHPFSQFVFDAIVLQSKGKEAFGSKGRLSCVDGDALTLGPWIP